MSWPPNKSWTSLYLQQGFRHFVAINYGGISKERWVLLVSVLDGRSRLIVKWSELKDVTKWNSGWLSITMDEANPPLVASTSRQRDFNQICLHPSKDSGLLIPSETISIRPWEKE